MTRLLAASHLPAGHARRMAMAVGEDLGRLALSSSLPHPVSANVSEEGVVSLVWVSGAAALLVVLTGDGEASFSVRREGGLFTQVSDFLVENGLPHAAAVVLRGPEAIDT